MSEFNAAEFVLSMALGKAFEAGRKRGRAEIWSPQDIDAGKITAPDWETWYRKEMKLDEKTTEAEEA